MAIKPIDSYDDDDMLESDTVNTGHMVKMGFLMLIIVLGAFYGWYSFSNRDTINKRMVRAGVKPTSAIKPTPSFKATKEEDLDTDHILAELKNESAKVIDSSMRQAGKIGGNVLGSATEQVQNTASSSAQAVTDTLYENTVGKVILQLFSNLPPEAKKGVAEDICKETETCKVDK